MVLSGCSREFMVRSSKEERECLEEELVAIRGIWEEPWCLGGDFNIILF